MNKSKITRNLVEKDYSILKANLIKSYLKDDFERIIKFLKIIGRLMYNFNIFYTDDEVEEIIKKCSNKLNIDIKKTEEKRVIFYDYFSLDNRGLTEQYLEALMKLDYDILYMTLQKDKNKMKNILEKLSGYKKSEVYIIQNEENLNSCNEIISKVIEFEASKVFIHTAPWDSIGFITWSAFENKIDRYFINLTDHTFWLGKNTADYFIEFRSYGKNISIDYRNIEEKKLLILPYYPIQNKKEKFQGFNFDYKNKKIIFSGGSLYKIYGSNVFFDLVKHILEIDRDTIFLYLGNGDEKPLKQFIKENNYQKRFYFENERRDINEIFKRCYFYLGTFPICGGLMSQFAAMNNKLPIAYTSKNLPMNLIEELFINVKNRKFTFTDIEEIKTEITKILKNQEYLNEKILNISEVVISKEEFKNELENIIKNKQSKFSYKKYKINIEIFSELYFQQENNYLKNYHQLFIEKDIKVALKFKKYYTKVILKKIFTKILRKRRKVNKI